MHFLSIVNSFVRNIRLLTYFTYLQLGQVYLHQKQYSDLATGAHFCYVSKARFLKLLLR